MTLTHDQRLLLSMVWPGRMAGVFLTPDSEIPALRQSHAGGGWPARPDLPDWFRSYDCTPKGIIGGPINGGPPHVTVTWTELARFARTIPADLLAELRAADRSGGTGLDRRRAALLAVLGLGAEPVGQLELFGADPVTLAYCHHYWTHTAGPAFFTVITRICPTCIPHLHPPILKVPDDH